MKSRPIFNQLQSLSTFELLEFQVREYIPLPFTFYRPLSLYRYILREVAKLCNPKNDFNTGRCKCKSSCKDRPCACRQKGAQCSTKCHNGSSCQNQPHDHLLIRKRQRQPSLILTSKKCKNGIETDEVTTSSSIGINGEKKDSPICIEDTATDKVTTPWSSSLCLTFNDKIILEKVRVG